MGTVRAFKENGANGRWVWELNEYQRGMAQAESETVKERVEKIKKKVKESELLESKIASGVSKKKKKIN